MSHSVSRRPPQAGQLFNLRIFHTYMMYGAACKPVVLQTWYGKEVNSENSSTGSLHMSILGLFNHNAVNADVAHTMFLSNS